MFFIKSHQLPPNADPRNGKKLGTYDGAKSEPELKDYIARMAADLPEPEMPDLESLRPKKPAKKTPKTKTKKTEL